MTRHVTAENFAVTGDRMYLGGRIMDGSAILYASFDKRISGELLGLCLGVAACLLLALYVGTVGAALTLPALGAVLAAGAYREIRRPYVLVLELYQIGRFEVRGFTLDEAIETEALLDRLRFRGDRAAGRRAGAVA